AQGWAQPALTPCSLPLPWCLPCFPLYAQAKTQLNMGLESITNTDGALGGIKPLVFFGASFFPSLFLAGYFLGGYYPGLAVGAPEEPSWWPTSMQV
ncbi:MAG: hypothetical protein ACPIOQ_76630, partial [Promethearchaeia archaeon]